MNKKRLMALCAAAIMTVSLFAGCGSTPKQGAGETAKTIKVGLATDEGGLNDKSFNQAADEGIKKAKTELKNVDYKAIESKKKDEYQPNLQALVDSGSELIFGVGYQMKGDIETMAKKYPDKKFAIIDDVVDAKNVSSLTFKEQEGSFLTGVIAAKMTKTGKIGFIGGKLDSDVITRFASGYIAGARAVNPNIKLDVRDAKDFGNSSKGEEMATTMYNGGCDVIYHAAGGTGIGLFKATKSMTKPEKKLWAIGVDKDQAVELPEYADIMLTSMVKRVDLSTYTTTKDFVKDGKFDGGKVKVYGLKEEGVDLAPTSNKNTPKEILDSAQKYKKDIIDAKIIVPTKIDDANKFTTTIKY